MIHIVAGPTASGKSAFAIELAKRTNGVIINADSMQVYDGLRILTAQPPDEDKAEVPHELYGVSHPNDTCSAGNWREMAEPLIRKILAAGKTPVITGGSGLYIKALTDGLSPMPDTPHEIRAAATAKQKELGNPAFHAELEKRDPVMAARLDPQNTARLVRAWEVLEVTGKSLAEWQKQDRLAPPDEWNFEIHKIMPERDELQRRCNDRFLQMMKTGAPEEVKNFDENIEKGIIRADVALVKALGFRPLREYIRGRLTKAEAIEKSQAETRRYAKRQVTWFRHQL